MYKRQVNSDVLRRMTISAPKDWADLTDPVYQELIWLPTYRSTEIGRLTAYSAALRLGRDKGLDYLAALDTSGCSIQERSSRLPIEVSVLSSTQSSVPRFSRPRIVSVNSRLARVTGESRIYWASA